MTGLFRLANKPDDGAGAVAPASPLVAVVLEVWPIELAPLSAVFAVLANNPPALVAAGVAVDASAVEVPRLLNKPDVPVPAVVGAGVDDGCVVAVGAEEGKLNAGLVSAEVVAWDVAVASARVLPRFAKTLEFCAAPLGSACCDGCNVPDVAPVDTVAGGVEAAAIFSCVRPRLPKSPPAGFDAALMLKRPVPEFVLAFADRLDNGAVVDVAAVVSPGLLDPNAPPDADCGMLPNRLLGAVVLGIS